MYCLSLAISNGTERKWVMDKLVFMGTLGEGKIVIINEKSTDNGKEISVLIEI